MADYDERNEDLTERYLLNQLNEEEMADFQARMLLDTRLRKEVQVMRALQKSLRAGRTTTSKKERIPGWILRWGVFFAIVLAGLLFYLHKDRGSDVQNKPVLPPGPRAQEQTRPEPIPETTVPQKPSAPVAANMVANPALERLLTSNLRGSDQVEVVFPEPGSKFARQNGRIHFRISGILDIGDDQSESQWRVLIFSNDKADYEKFKPEWIGKPVFKPENGRLRFVAGQNIAIRPGLYYYLFENAESGEVLKAGKFYAE